jgi:enoyl-CoA hydratase/carnithine racemase
VPTPFILTALSDGVCSIEISRRDKRNAITTEMYRGMSDALDEAGANPSARAVLLRGQDDLFTAGNDVADFLDPATREAAQAYRFLLTISAFPKPIVAAVGGAAVGIGTTMLMHCDLVIASDTARFQLPFVPLGLCPEAGSSMLLPQMAGPKLAAELLYLGDFFDAETAQRAGLVNHVVPAPALMVHALGIAQRIAHQPVDALMTTKALLRRPLGRPVRDVIEEEYPHFARLLASDEARAIFQAFLGKR